MTALEVDPLDSLGWRGEGQVHVALHLPDLHLPEVASGDMVEVRFRDGDRRVRRPGTIAAATRGSLVEVATPAPRLAGGLWQIAVRVGDADSFTPVEARLLVRRDQPVALLPGPAPRTRMSEPEPSPIAPSAPESARRLAARVLRRVRSRGRR